MLKLTKSRKSFSVKLGQWLPLGGGSGLRVGRGTQKASEMLLFLCFRWWWHRCLMYNFYQCVYYISCTFSEFLFFFSFLGPHLEGYGSSQARGRIGATAVAYARATATWDPSCVCDLHHSSEQHWILNLLKRGQGLHLQPHGSYSDSLTTEPPWEL